MMIHGYRVHCCLFDLSCWRDYWRYGMPMRLHLGERFWTFPLLSGDWRQRYWEWTPAQVTAPPKDWTEDDSLTEPEIRSHLVSEGWESVVPVVKGGSATATFTADAHMRTMRCEHIEITGPGLTGWRCHHGCEMEEVTR